MESETRNSRSLKRKPLSDRTNLIRKLSSPLSSKPPNPNQFPIPKQSNSSSKPQKPGANSSKSDSSIVSSNSSNKYEHSPSRVPQPYPSTPPNPATRSVSINHGNGDSEMCEPLVVYSRFHSREKTKSKGKAVAVPFSCIPQEKSKDKGKAISVAFSCPPAEKTNDKGNAIAVTLSCSPVEKTKDKGKAIAVPFNCFPSEKTKDKGKSVDITPAFPSLAKTKDKGKAIAIPANCPENTKDRGRGVSMSFSCPPLPRSRNIRNDLNEDGDIANFKAHTGPHMKDKKKRRCLPRDQDVPKYGLPQDFIEQQRAYFKEIDEFELPEEEISYNELDKEE